MSVALDGRWSGRRAADPLIDEARERQRRRRRRLTVVPAVLVGAGAIGFGIGHGTTRSASAGARTAPIPNPCTLVSSRTVGSLLGSAIASRARTGNRLYSDCVWTGVPLGGFGQSSRSLRAEVTRTTRSRFVAAEKRIRAQRVRGVGEVAFETPLAGTPVLSVYAHGYAIQVIAALVTSPLAVEIRAGRALAASL